MEKGPVEWRGLCICRAGRPLTQAVLTIKPLLIYVRATDTDAAERRCRLAAGGRTLVDKFAVGLSARS